MTSKINSHLKEINFVNAILPITDVILETGNFDTHALKNPEVLKNKWLYQKGINYGFANTKAYVLAGTATLMDINNNTIDFSHMPRGMKTPKMSNFKLIKRRKSWIIQEKTIQTIVC